MGLITSPHIGSPHIEKAGISQPHIVTPKGIKPVLKLGYSRGLDASGNPLWRNEMAGGAALDAAAPGGAANPTAHASLPGYTLTRASSQYFGVGGVSDLIFPKNTGVFTITAWAKTDDYTIDDFFAIAGSKITTGDHGWGFFYDNRSAAGSPKCLSFSISRGTSGTYGAFASTSNDAITSNEFHFLWARGDGSNIYLGSNKISEGSGAISALGSGNHTSSPLVGAMRLTPIVGFWGGAISEVNIFPICLPAAQINAVYQQTRHIYGV